MLGFSFFCSIKQPITDIYLFVCLSAFCGILTFVCYLMQNPFNTKTVLFQIIHFSISTQFNCKKKKKLFQAINFSQTVLIQTIQFSLSTQFDCQKYFYFKIFTIVK